MPGYVHFTHDAIRDRTFINVVKEDPNRAPLSRDHSDTYTSKLVGGWRNDQVFTRDADGKRVFKLINLKTLPPVQKHDLSAVDFDAMSAHLKAMRLDDALAVQGHQYPDRFKQVYQRIEADKNATSVGIFELKDKE
jgi:hypothetical protein